MALSTVGRPPGVLVTDERPQSRPMTQASLGGCAMVCQLTIPDATWAFDPERHVVQLNSFEDFVNLLGGQSFVARLAVASGFQLDAGGRFVRAGGTAAEAEAVTTAKKKADDAGTALEAAKKKAGAATAAATASPDDDDKVLAADEAKQEAEDREKDKKTADDDARKAVSANPRRCRTRSRWRSPRSATTCSHDRRSRTRSSA